MSGCRRERIQKKEVLVEKEGLNAPREDSENSVGHLVFRFTSLLSIRRSLGLSSSSEQNTFGVQFVGDG